MGRTVLRLPKGGIVPIDFNEDDEVWGSALIECIQTAMATFSLRINFLSANEVIHSQENHARPSQLPADSVTSSMKCKKPLPRGEKLMQSHSSTVGDERAMKVIGHRVAKAILAEKKANGNRRKFM